MKQPDWHVPAREGLRALPGPGGEAQRLVADAFDTIIGLESGKLRPADVE